MILTATSPSHSVQFEPLLARALARLRAALPGQDGRLSDPHAIARIERVAIASDFAIDTLARQPALLERLLHDDGAQPLEEPVLDAINRADWPALLRRYRAAGSTRLIWRDVLGLDDVDGTLAGSTHLAERCLQIALAAIEQEFAQRHGLVRDRDGVPQRLVVFGLGKLGGGELNFSSDVDLVYTYEHDGESDGARPLDAEHYFARLGQQLAKLLDELTVDGFCHRVDLRLRPYGNAGRVAWSFTAMEQYFQREGRDWERYAWQKARPVAGDAAAGERFLESLRPFVYRRYLDFGALDGLRGMKAAISAEVARKELADDIKRGPGGIREIEFLVQALQLIYGGREPSLRDRRLLPSLAALMEARQMSVEAGDMLATAYRFLRGLENRLQMLRDAQTHALPEREEDRDRIAASLGYADWSGLREALDAQRARVTAEFEALLTPRRRRNAPDALTRYWHALPDGSDSEALADAGFIEAGNADAALRDFARSPGVRGLSDNARARLDRVLPSLLQAAAASSEPMLALRRLLALLHNVLRRSAYLALLDEQPVALARLVEVVTHSALLAERLASYPLLLDELLDARVAGPLPGRDELHAACADVARDDDDDAEAVLQALNEVRQALSFRIAMAVRDGRLSAADGARQLAWLADGVVMRVLRLAEHEVAGAHGRVPGARFAVIGYGSLGGEELGFGSDLDLVFIYDSPGGEHAHSDGARPLEATRWFARVAQKVVALLGAVTGAGRLYDVDVRLRPDGAKGLLVSSLASYRDYQRERAWTWEHQALVRARFVAGDESLGADVEDVRRQTLSRERDAQRVCEDVVSMRRRMRAELDRSDAAAFDLKQGEGGLVDLEFLLQYAVLAHSARHAQWLSSRNTRELIHALGESAWLSEEEVAGLTQAHAVFVDAGLACTLDRRPRRLPINDAIAQAREAIIAASHAHGLVFDA
ncbi:bifunctional [glutamate--ammonia ligase]-adenylyl-L-tyrosine phosphorylase/[glutamate--ammonia-ligase] adenylyltransferase [Lysobacter sp. MMG2]|uniref:bifunctional [glutamate--ammonia ligase]-adenylyl-L-tyrosine phosphorylase/[glutamate--ammonia-ligase] adenylyltransferase n=1 Tax=Lysobacter sp. MMG2 TaxID=2801338 RepID=UPI001C225603|nr:bifunctional [glutamate--ammonia ligase]-adenylyl-L-tyrosine phosphorylase/[glutamate--ammonia-ligase] adenylyltransferase [Lysobacter sp. MMG2]MBU8977691.1 bifunctional [glutamate--ammonia ligase]-adenylyl-L-tyrosine phosphorylase/[glutamate--ammonia-ligase] adenylyltransferase [Lysobacter sp. MMG2]